MQNDPRGRRRPVHRRGLAAGLATGLAVAALTGHGEAKASPHETAILGGLDKVTAVITTLEVPIGDVIRFGTLELIVRMCDKRPPEEPPESAAFLDIWESRPGKPSQSVFRGWMFASSPALSALEHPVYDVWVVDCRDPAKGDEPGAPE